MASNFLRLFLTLRSFHMHKRVIASVDSGILPLAAQERRRDGSSSRERMEERTADSLRRSPPTSPLDEPSNTMSTTKRTTAAAAKTGEEDSTPSSPTATEKTRARSYRDYSTYMLDGNKVAEPKDNFPAKLHRILSDDANSPTIVWMVRQRAVVVYQEKFISNVKSTKASRPSLPGGA